MQALYDYAFATDSCMTNSIGGVSLVLIAGDPVEVYSERHKCWFRDGTIETTYRGGVSVRYGLDRYFGFSLTRGNTKFVRCADIRSKLRIRKVRKVVESSDDS